MELNAEINRVFGEEMAKIFAAKIPEEELYRLSQNAFNAIIKVPEDRWGKITGDDQLTALIKRMIFEKTTEFIKKELEKPDSEEILQERAKRIVANAKEIAEKEITARMARSFYYNAINVDYSRSEENNLLSSLMDRLNNIERKTIYGD